MAGLPVDAIIAAFDSVEMSFADSELGWRYGGRRDLSQLAEDAQEADTAGTTDSADRIQPGDPAQSR